MCNKRNIVKFFCLITLIWPFLPAKLENLTFSQKEVTGEGRGYVTQKATSPVHTSDKLSSHSEMQMRSSASQPARPFSNLTWPRQGQVSLGSRAGSLHLALLHPIWMSNVEGMHPNLNYTQKSKVVEPLPSRSLSLFSFFFFFKCKELELLSELR